MLQVMKQWIKTVVGQERLFEGRNEEEPNRRGKGGKQNANRDLVGILTGKDKFEDQNVDGK